jgi:Tfp pilus assembly protein PilF
MHMHHYCSALLDIFHAQTAMDDANQNRLYRRAMSDIEYMEARVSTGFVLWPDMLHNRARIERAQGNTGAAVHSLQQAITRKADYPPPYAELADIHVSLGQGEEARKVLEAGLAQQPNSRLLLRKMSCLDDRNAPGCR